MGGERGRKGWPVTRERADDSAMIRTTDRSPVMHPAPWSRHPPLTTTNAIRFRDRSFDINLNVQKSKNQNDRAQVV